MRIAMLVLLAALGGAPGTAGLKSGLAVGAKLPALEIRDPEATGDTGTEVRRDVGAGPVVLVFVKPGPAGMTLTDRAQALVDRHARDAAPVAALVIFLGGPETRPKLERSMKEHSWQLPVYYLPTGKPPAPFKINSQADSTVLVARGGLVIANFVNLDATTFDQVERAAAPGR